MFTSVIIGVVIGFIGIKKEMSFWDTIIAACIASALLHMLL